jgi:hypothetical protein
MAMMPEQPDDLDEEPDYRQEVVDSDAVSELSELNSRVDGIADEVRSLDQSLDKIVSTLDEIGHFFNSRSTLQALQFRLSVFLLLITVGVVVILGTLRHWF